VLGTYQTVQSGMSSELPLQLGRSQVEVFIVPTISLTTRAGTLGASETCPTLAMSVWMRVPQVPLVLKMN
jgi:hypothetical protein